MIGQWLFENSLNTDLVLIWVRENMPLFLSTWTNLIRTIVQCAGKTTGDIMHCDNHATVGDDLYNKSS